MALFKIFKGTDTKRLTDPSYTQNGGYIQPVDGYCYFDTTTGLFFIDANLGTEQSPRLVRAPINANIAEQAICDIEGNQINNTYARKGHGVYYGTCDTAAGTKPKVVELVDKTGFELKTGTIIFVKFTYANSASSPTLQVKDTGTAAKPMYRYGTTAISTGTTSSGWYAGSVQMFVYDGTGWIRDYWNNTTYSNAGLGQGYGECTTAESTAAKLGALSNYSLTLGGIVSIKFTNGGVPANATLNINNKGAKNIFYKGAAIPAGIIKAGDTATFIYNGENYHLIAIDRWQDDISNIVNSVNNIETQVGYNTDNISIISMSLSDLEDILLELFGYMYASDWDINNPEGLPPSIREIAEDVANEAVKNKVDKIDGKGLSTNDYTTTEKNKLANIAANAEVNQNAFSNVVVGSTTISADTKTDSLTIASGSGISVSGDATNDKVTITNTGVRSISTGTANGTISVNTNGSSANVTVKGLGSAAYTNTNAYDAAGAAAAAETAAKAYADQIKNNLLNGAGAAYDTLKELGNLIDDNQDAIEALETIASGKAPAVHTHEINQITDLPGTLADKLTKSSNNVLNDDVTMKFSSSTDHSFTISGSGMALDLSAPDGWNNRILSVKDKLGDITTILGGVGDASGLTHLYMGGSSNDPYLKMTKNGYVSFKYTPKVGDNALALAKDVALVDHTHNYAGAASPGAAANSALKLTTSNKGSAVQPVYFANGVPVATTYSLNATVPANAVFTDTHYKAIPRAGANGATNVGETENGETYINIIENGANSGGINIKGSGAVTVTSDANGAIDIHARTYSNATTSAAGLMSAADKTKLNGIAAGATANIGTITEVKVNGSSVTSGAVEIPSASTSVYGVTKLSSATNSTSEVLAATPKAVKAAYDLAASKAGTSVATTTANGLMSANDKIKLNNTNIAYGTCDTAADVAEKAVVLNSNTQWKLETGAIIMVKFANSNSASNVKINVNSTGAYPIYYNNAVYTSTSTTYTGYANRVTMYMFNGTHWVWISNSYDTNSDTYQRVYPTTTNKEYPITARYNTTTGSSYYAEYGRYSTGVTLNPSTNTITATAFKGALTGNADTATALTSNAGSTTQPVYFVNGKPKAIDYTIESSVPANAKFTDTTYSTATTSTAGLMSAADKTKLNGLSNYTLPAAGETLGGVKSGGDVTINNGVITVSDDSHNHVVSNIDGLQTTLTGLQNAIDGKSGTDHTHKYAGSATSGGPANSVKESLSFKVGGIDRGSYNGSEAHTITVNAVDLNISGALTYIGRTNTNPETIAKGTTTIDIIGQGSTTVSSGNVVIYTDGNVEWIYDSTGEWIQLGEASSFSLAPHIHGNISNQGYLTNDQGTEQGNKILITNGTGLIVPSGPTISSTKTAKYLNENGTWQAIPDVTTSASGLMTKDLLTKLNGIAAGANKYTLPKATTTTLGGVIIGSNINVTTDTGTISVPNATKDTAGVTVVYPADSCTTFTSDSGTATPKAIKKAVDLFAITKAAGGTFDSGAADQASQPSLKWVKIGENTPYIGFATDQSDGTFLITSLKGTTYATGLAIGGGSGNLLWKGKRVLTVDDTFAPVNHASNSNTYGLGTDSRYGHVKLSDLITDTGAATGGTAASPKAVKIAYDLAASKASTDVATTTTDGLMSSTDKVKLDGLSNYSLPAATTTTLGGVIVGTNISVTNGKISVPNASTSVVGAVKLSSATNSSDETLAATPKAVNDALTIAINKANEKLPLAGGNMTGHIFMTGSSATDSVNNSTQLVFGTSETQHIAISANDKALVLNPSTSSNTNQIVLNLNAVSQFPQGVNKAAQLTTARTINGMSFNGTENINNYGVCETAAGTAAKTVTVGSTFTLATGAQVVVKFTNANSVASPTLNVNGTGAKPIYRYGTTVANTDTTTNGWIAGAVQRFTYDGTGWIMDYWYNTTYYTTAVTCSTAAATAAKVGSTSYFTLANNRHFYVMFVYDNTAASALTLNINSTGAKPIYINGSASSASNYTLPKGLYHCYYDGSRYYIDTNGAFRTNTLIVSGAGQVGSQFTIARSTSIADNLPASLIFKTTQTDNSVSTTSGIYCYDDHDSANYGHNMVITSNGNLIIGGGESAANCYATDFKDDTGENTYITADGNIYFYTNCNTYANAKKTVYIDTTGVLYGAAWNDYAEYRITKEEIEPGRCVIENGDDTLSLSTERLQRGCEIVSDTFGFAIGETEESKTPIAATGRVLCYLLEGREKAKSHIGWPVCSGPNGTVSIMTEEEEEKYPSRIIGTISAVPDYEEWGSGNVKVNGRVWIRIK